MKTRYKRTRTLSFVLSLLFLLQCCHVYYEVPISLDEAVAADRRIKVTTTNEKKYKFRKIEKTDSIYYGIVVTRGQKAKVPLDTKKIQSIRPVNKTASTVLTVGAIAVPVFIITAIIAGPSYIVEDLFELPAPDDSL